jgi:TrmH family RNA methyltransferase
LTTGEIKYYSGLKQKKYRDSENKFLIEGEHLIEECLKSEFYKTCLKKIFIRNDYLNNDLIIKIKNSDLNIELIDLNEKTFNRLAETVNSQGIIGVVSKLNSASNKIPFGKKFIVALDSVNDPGNLGSIIRTSYWFGADGLLIGSDSVDVFNSKVIRATQGAIFHLIIEDRINLESELIKYFESGFNIVLADLNSDKSLSDFKFIKERKYIFVFGNEANGISKRILENENYIKLKIKGFSDCESLNISVSAGIVLNEFINK